MKVMLKKRFTPQYPPSPPITAANYRHDEPVRELLRSWGYVLEAPKPKGESSEEAPTAAGASAR
jgi:hypothetical protein